MESKHKNILIGTLLAVVFVMAVGYAAFAQQLQINGTARINSTWDVHFNQTQLSGVGKPGFSGGTTPTGTISYTNAHTASLTANLYQPGDTVTFTLTIENGGSITADLGTPTVTMDGDEDGTGNLTAKKGNIQFTVTAPSPTTIAQSDSATMTVKAEFISSATSVGSASNATVNIQLNATQATA